MSPLEKTVNSSGVGVPATSKKRNMRVYFGNGVICVIRFRTFPHWPVEQGRVRQISAFKFRYFTSLTN